MRSSLYYGVFIISCCILLHTAYADKKKFTVQENNDIEVGNSGRKLDKNRDYQSKNYNINKNKSNKEGEKQIKLNKVAEASSEETTETPEIQKNKKSKVKQHEDSDEKVFFTKVKKANHVIKHYRKVKIHDDDGSKESGEDQHDLNGGKTNKKITKRKNDSDENFSSRESNKKIKGNSKKNNKIFDKEKDGDHLDSNGDIKNHKGNKCKNSKNGKNCNNSNEDNSDEILLDSEEDQNLFKPKIKYSTKFKHEKQKNNEDRKGDLSILRLHRKRGRDNDDDDSSSEEDESPFPKRNLFTHDDD